MWIAWVDGEATANDGALLSEHARSCVSCRRYWNRVKDARRWLETSVQTRKDSSFNNEVMARLRAPKASPLSGGIWVLIGSLFLAGAGAWTWKASSDASDWSQLERCLETAKAYASKSSGVSGLTMVDAVSSSEVGRPLTDSRLIEIDFDAPDGRSWEITCDSHTGNIIEVEREVASSDDEHFSARALISEDRARGIALAAYPGMILETQYEIEANGAATYEFEVSIQQEAATRVQNKVEVDAQTGSIVEVRRATRKPRIKS
jgi:uncharacterized membrane protein YkoI